MQSSRCATCNAPTSARFCAQCGSRAISAEDLGFTATVRYFWQEADIPARVVSTLWTLLAKPGALTHAYVRGAVGLYAHPVRLLLAAVALYFLVAGPYWLDVNVDRQAIPAPATVAQDQRLLDAWKDSVINVQSVSRLLGPVGLCMALLLLRARQREPFGQHLIFAVHYYCFDFVWAGLLAGASVALTAALPETSLPNWWIPIFGGLWLWAMLAFHRAYRSRWWVAVLSGSTLIVFDVMLTSLADGIAVGYANAQFAAPNTPG